MADIKLLLVEDDENLAYMEKSCSKAIACYCSDNACCRKRRFRLYLLRLILISHSMTKYIP